MDLLALVALILLTKVEHDAAVHGSSWLWY